MRLLSSFLPFLLAGCATAGLFENTASCTPDKKQMVFCSWYKDICVGVKVWPQDAELYCKEKGV